MEQKIMEVLRRMQAILDEACLRDLKTVLQVVFEGCEISQEKRELRVSDRNWAIDLEEYLMSKALEGKSPGTVDRYRYELQRLLSYVNKAVRDITEGDISGYMRAYKAIRQVSNQTLKNVRAVYSSFFAWLRDRDRIRRNPMALVERRVYLNDRTNLYMKEYLDSRTDESPALFVSTRKPHSRLSKTGIEDIIRRTGQRAGVEKAHPHRFRRTSLTNALNRGMPLQEAMVMAGHAKPETTMGYCTVDQEGVKYHHQKYLSA